MMKQEFVESAKGSGDKYFIDLREISHIIEHRAAVTIYLRTDTKKILQMLHTMK